MFSKPTKPYYLSLMKLVFAGSLLCWMSYSGKLDFSALHSFWGDPLFVFMTVFVWLFTTVLGAVRWWLLLTGTGYDQRFMRVFQLHLSGVFFNTAMPGAVGGDLVKATYVYLDEPQHGKTHAMTSVLIDRVLGLLGLFSICGIVMLYNIGFIMSEPALSTLALPVFGLFVFAVGFLVFVANGLNTVPLIRYWLDKRLIGYSLVKKVLDSFEKLKGCKERIVWGLLLSVFIQGSFLLYFWRVSIMVLDFDIDLTLLSLVFPIGILITVIPLAPGGLGVGHLAFNSLFAVIGLENGATIFNIYILSLLVLNLCSGIAYLFVKSRKVDINPGSEATEA